MPKPPVLPLVDWPAVIESGLDFKAWLEIAESPEHRRQMQATFDALALEPAQEACLGQLAREVHVVAIAEDWCGDVVRFAPVLARVAAAAGCKVKVRFISREQHPQVFIRYLTNGGEAIPKFVFLNDRFVECGNWGPMPAECRRILSRGKGANDVGAARLRVSSLYESDPHFEAAVREMIEFIETAVCMRP